MTTDAYRIPAQDFCMSDSMPFQQHWEVRVGVPMARIVGNPSEAFHTMFNVLRPGDLITVCTYGANKEGQFAELHEVAEFRVTKKHVMAEGVAPRIEATLVKDVFVVPKAGPETKKPLPAIPLHKVKVGTTWEVRDVNGITLEQLADEAQAVAFINRVPGGVEVDPPKAKKAA